ncbi:MAG: hypothetical protein OXN83_05810, partial [Oligoflexia bacterium]|nr:hypothetical protein [Oligoflexia bacterium]
MKMQYLKRRYYKTLSFTFLFLFLGSFSALADSFLCDCELIRRVGKCSNPDCISICDFQTSLDEISSSIVEQCLGKESLTLYFRKANASATEIPDFTETAEQKIEDKENKIKNKLLENCPHCELDSSVSAHFKVVSPKRNCPAQYLKDYHYQNEKKMALKKGICEKDKIFQYFGKYVEDLVSSGGSSGNQTSSGATGVSGSAPQSKQEDTDSVIQASRDLWKACPDPCSFDVSYVVKIDEEKCEGELNVKVGCTHRVRKSFWGVPIYN